MSDELWFRFFPSKFMAGVRGLNANEVKVYISLLCRMYERGGPLKNDDEILATYCEMRPSSYRKALDRLLRLEKLSETPDGHLTNTAAEREISRRESYSENAKRAGKKSAEKRQQNQRPSPTDAQPSLNHKEKRREESPPPTTVDRREGAREAGRRLDEIPDEDPFEATSQDPVGGASDDHLYAEVLAAAGWRNGRVPFHWQPPHGIIHIGRWRRDHGLTETEIVQVVRSSRQRHDEAPQRPSAFDRSIQAFADAKRGGGAKRAGKSESERDQRMRFYASVGGGSATGTDG